MKSIHARVEAARPTSARVDAARDDRVHQPGAVEVRAQPVRARDVEHGLDLLAAARRARRPRFVVCSTHTSRERGA